MPIELHASRQRLLRHQVMLNTQVGRTSHPWGVRKDLRRCERIKRGHTVRDVMPPIYRALRAALDSRNGVFVAIIKRPLARSIRGHPYRSQSAPR
jgi:hypothetical protein